jgi:hypothetical protein
MNFDVKLINERGFELIFLIQKALNLPQFLTKINCNA